MEDTGNCDIPLIQWQSMLGGNISYDSFAYVVERKEQAKICFGSAVERKTGPSISPNPVSPFSYDLRSGLFEFLNKVTSRRGFGTLADGAQRFDQKIRDHAPSPTRYNITLDWPTLPEAAAPFGKKSKRKPLVQSNTPGPGTYNACDKLCRRSRYEINFGNTKMLDCVEEFCVPKPSDYCGKCTELCQGDYWQINYCEFLCQVCMTEENALHEMYTVEQLKAFKKMRNCDYRHQHEGTTAAIRLLPGKTIRKKKKIENYLDMFIKC